MTSPIIISSKRVKSISWKVADQLFPYNIKSLKAPGMPVDLVIELEDEEKQDG